MQSINLIPQQEVQEQVEEKAVTLSTWISIALLVITGAVAGFYIYRSYTLKNQIKGAEGEISSLRQQITALAQVEVNARNLDKKYATLKDIFANRILFSTLSTEILARKPDGVSIDSMTLQKGDSLNITGHAENYILIAALTNNLVDKNYDKGDPTLKTVFSSVTLNSVSLEKTRNIVLFSINVNLNADLLKKK